MAFASVHQQPDIADGRDGGRYCTVAQAAQKLQVHRTTIMRWIEAGRLQAYRVGPKAVRIMERDLEAAVTPANGKREGATRMREQEHAPVAIQTRLPTRRLTDEEIERGLAALRRLRAFREELAARHGGPLLPPSEAVIREEREARSKRL